MSDDLSLNPIQAAIIRRLFRHSRQRFAELNADAVPSDHFAYHVRQLLKTGMIEKDDDGIYGLTVVGKTRAIMLSPEESRFIAQGFVAVVTLLSREVDGVTEYLVQERANEPYKGTLQSIGDKINFGEDVEEAAHRSFREQTGLDCDKTYRGTAHFKDLYHGKVVQDKYFFVYSGTNPRGELLPAGRTGRNLWMTRAEIEKSGRAIQGMIEIADAVASKVPVLIEATFEVDRY